MKMIVTIDSRVSFSLTVLDTDYVMFGGICQPEAGYNPCQDYFEGHLSPDQVDMIRSAHKSISVSIDEPGVRDIVFPAEKTALALKLLALACDGT